MKKELDHLAHKGHEPAVCRTKCSLCPLEIHGMLLYSCECGLTGVCSYCMAEHLRQTAPHKPHPRKATISRQQKNMRKQMLQLTGHVDETIYAAPRVA